MKLKIFIVCVVLLVSMFAYTGCKNNSANTADTIIAELKLRDNLKLMTATKVDDDDIIYVFEGYGTQVFVCKNLKTNTVSISTNK